MKKYFHFILGVVLISTTISFSQFTKQKYFDGDSLCRYTDRYDDGMMPSSTLTDSNLTVVGGWWWGPCYAVDVRGNYSFIGDGKQIQVFDITDPSNPTMVAEYNTGGLVKEIKLKDSLAYVCSAGLQIFNISKLDSIYEVGRANIWGAKEVVVTDSFAYVLAGTMPPLVYVVDITNVSSPYVRSLTPTASDFILDMDVKDRFIYVTGDNLGFLTIIDAHNPDRPVHYDQLLTSNAIQIRDTLMYLGKGPYLAIYSISDPINPVFLDTAYTGTTGTLREMIVQGNYAYSTNDSGLFVFDITNPRETLLAGHLPAIKAFSLAIQNNLLHMATNSTYRIINIANPDSMYCENIFFAGGIPADIAIQGHYAYVATLRTGLTVLDLSNPIAPVRIGVLPLNGGMLHIFASDSLVYLGTDSTVYLIEISNPKLPYLVSTIKADSFNVGYLYESNKRLYIICPSSRTLIYDVSNSRNPTYLGSYPLAGRELIVRDSIAFHANGTGGFVIENISDLSNPVELARFSYNTFSIKLRDAIAYLATTDGLMMLDVANPSAPESLSFIGAPSGGMDISPSGKYIYMSSYYKRTMILDVSDLRNPIPTGILEGFGSNKIRAYCGYIYVCEDHWITILKNDLISSVEVGAVNLQKEFMLYQNYPNPFNNVTKILYQLPVSDNVKISIFDITGKLIQDLDLGYQYKGIHEYFWTPENLSTGIYIIRLSSLNQVLVKKALLIK